MRGPLARLCFNHISCPKKNGFVAEPLLGRTIAKDKFARNLVAMRPALYIGYTPRRIAAVANAVRVRNATAACKHIHSRASS